MDYDAQLKLQAFLDGELPPAEASQVESWLARDREATALLAELRNTREAMGGFEVGVQLPESREFFWSKIQREIQPSVPPAPEPAAAPFFALLRRWLLPTAAAAALAITVLLAIPSARSSAEMSVADSGAFTYHDFSAGATLVWLSYPAENEVAQNDETDTLD